MSLQRVVLAVGQSDTDRIEAMGQTVTDIAGPAGAEVSLAHMFTSEEYADVRDQLGIDHDAEHSPDDVAKRHRVVRTLGDALTVADVDYSIQGRVGDHGEEIVSLAEELDADLVVVGGRKRSPVGKAVFGSTAQRIMLDAPCPVTFVRDN